MRCFRKIAALVGATALAGCYEVYSEVPMVSDAARLAESPVAPGVYCPANADAGPDAALVEVAECLDVTFEGGELVATATDEETGETESVAFTLAALSRGATLLQAYDTEDERYVGYVAKTTPDGLAVLVEPELTVSVAAKAAELGVEVDAGDADLDQDPPDLSVLAGEADAVLELVDYAMVVRLEAALRDPEGLDAFLDDAIYYIRFDADPALSSPDDADARAKLARLREVVRFAVTLE